MQRSFCYTTLLIFALLFIISSLNVFHCDSSSNKKDETKTPNSGTDTDTLAREEEAIKIDGLNVAQIKELREKAEKHNFQAEVSRMMNLIINSLYKNKEIFLRELISNASDALDKIRFLSLTDSSALGDMSDLNIKIRADPEDNTLHIIDTGVGMTKQDLMTNLGTIAKSGTSDFIKKISASQSASESSDLIGQFGVGFYSSFLVAKRVTVISKNNEDSDQYIWESEGHGFSLSKDPRGNTLKRGTEIILHLKEETKEYLEVTALKALIEKYSQFINFPIYLWSSKTEMVDDDASAETPKKGEEEESAKKEAKDDDATVEEEKDKEKEKAKKVEKTTWDWELINNNKPIWTRNPADITEEEYTAFYKSFAHDSAEPMGKIHFKAEGEVTFNAMLFMPKTAPQDMFRSMSKTNVNMKLYVRRVFITDSLENTMPAYLNFIKGLIDSDDLPLNVSRENLQQSKLLALIKKKVVRKALEMISKLSKETFTKFWEEYGTNIKVGVTEDHSNRSRLSKLLRFWSSHNATEMVSLQEYVDRMKTTQKVIYYIAGENKADLTASPLVERVLKKGYEVLYMSDPIDEYAINALPDFADKKFQNLGKEGLELEEDAASKEKKEAQGKEFEALFTWLKDDILKDKVEKVVLSDRLDKSPCALVANQWGYSGNMDRIMRSQAYRKMNDAQVNFLNSQKHILEVNARHPLIKELLARMASEKEEETTKNMALVLFDTAVLRSGYVVGDMPAFATRIEQMMRLGLKVPLNEQVEEEEETGEEKEKEKTKEEL